MNNCEAVTVAANLLSAMIGFALMQTKYRGYTLLERLSLSCLLGALVVNASMHVLDGRDQGACAEAILSLALLFRFLTAALWRFLRCGKCPVTVLALAAGLFLLAGCSGYDREYRAEVDPVTGAGFAGVTIRPGSGERSFSGGLRIPAWNDDLPRCWMDK